MTNRFARLVTGGAMVPTHRFQRSVSSFQCAHVRLGQDLDVRPRGDAIDQIARHGRGETMAGRIVVPELRGGQCIWMVGRALDDDRQPKYWGLSLPKPILGYERVCGRPRAFVTEGAFDYLTGVSWGLPICALLGTQVRAGRLAFLERARRVLIVFDNDGPGCEAAAELAARLGSRARVVRLAEGAKDLNDLARHHDGRATFFRLLKEADRGGEEKTHEDEDVAEES